MFKNIIIAVLAVLLCAGAASSRPSEESFKTWYRQRAKLLAVAGVATPAPHRNLVDRIFHRGGSAAAEDPDSYLEKCVYHDRLLWADVEKDGKVVYSGAFSRWVAYDDVSGALKSKSQKG